MDCFGSRALRSIYGQLACLRLTWGCLLRRMRTASSTAGPEPGRCAGGTPFGRIRALAQCSCALYTSALCALQAPVSLEDSSPHFCSFSFSAILPHSYSSGPSSTTFHNSHCQFLFPAAAISLSQTVIHVGRPGYVCTFFKNSLIAPPVSPG